MAETHDHRSVKTDRDSSDVPTRGDRRVGSSGHAVKDRPPHRDLFKPVLSVAQLTDANPASRAPRSIVNTIGDKPAGFGDSISWNGDEDLAVVAFLSAADEGGIHIMGVTAGDTIEFHNSTLTATFAQESKNDHVGGIITFVAAGASLTAAAFGSPELAPFIGAAGEAMQKLFPKSKNPSKRRDAYGMDPATGDFGRQEGGVLVCSPAARGTWPSGDSDHQERWVSSKKDRDDEHVPAHVKHAFFLQRDMGPRHLEGDGDLILVAWDYSFADNIGTYRLDFILRRADEPGIVIE